MRKVLITDHPWPDIEIERGIVEAAGFELIAGPVEAQPAGVIETMVAEHDPVAIMTCWAQVSQKAIETPTQLKAIGRLGVGLDNIAIPAATARGAWVTNVPDYCVEEVSDHVVAMVLAFWRGTVALDREVKQGYWQPASARLQRVADKTIGIIGYGRIGTLTARKFVQGFGCRVLVNSRSLLQQVGQEVAPGVTAADIATIQRESDAVVLHAPLTSATRGIINEAFLANLPRKPLLINVSRGGLIDNEALVRALDGGLISGAGLDVIDGEPSPPKSVTTRTDVIATPHVAFSSNASLVELRRRCTEDVVRVLRGERPLHPCNQPASTAK
ncbi:MAG TPA: C-terminal binding protein [Povalibacter sp.]|nr:C-terminal binding protein [Povalibacter sp.]